MTVFNTSKVDYTQEPIFFGKGLNVQRYDTFKYPVFEKLTQRQLSFFWRPEEISLQKDRNDYLHLRPEHKFIFTTNLKYQTMLDSVQGRGPALALLPICSIPELESCILTWDFMETIHSRAYTYVIKNLYPDASVIYDSVLDDKMIIERSSSVTKNYDELLSEIYRYKAHPGEYKTKDAIKELKRKLYRALVSINILEGIRFYVSFACTFAFGEIKLMEGSAKIISLIARDESQHLAITQHILNAYNTTENDQQMKQIISEEMENTISMYRDAVDQEKAWAKCLFKDGSMIGLSENLLSNYIEWIANKRMKAVGLEPIYNQKASSNPLPWTQHWLNSKELQIAPQEAEIESYLVGGIKQDLNNDSFKSLSL